MPTPLVTTNAPVLLLVLTLVPDTSMLPVCMLSCPPTLTLPVIPAPPFIISAPVVVEVLAVLLPMYKLPTSTGPLR